MKTGRSNKFNRALGHIKSTNIDEKIRLLDEQPTNNTTQIYIDEPDTEVTTTLNPNLNELDLTQDALSTGRDTTGLFMPDGTILTEEPPGDTSYILGPMAAMYYTWSYPWTMLGYIRQSDRRMVNLARVNGKLSDWDGSSGFSSYGQLTLEQAVWFRDVQKQPGATNDPSTYNYYAFYPGPPTQSPDQYGRYPCAITGISKRRDVTVGKKPEGKGLDPNWGLGPYLRKPSGYMFVKNEKTGEWEKKYYYDDGTSETERSGDITPGHPDYDAYMLGGGDAAAEQGYSRNEIIRGGYEQIQRQENARAQQEFQNIMRELERIDQQRRDAVNDPYGNNREKYGPAFGDDKTANRERQKLIQQRNDAIYDYWKNNYVPAPGGAENDPLKDSLYSDIPMPDQLRNLLDKAPNYKKTEWGKQLDNLQNDPLWGPIIDATVGAIAMAIGKGAPGYARRGMVNPLGQRMTVRSGAAGRQRVDVYRGRPYQGDLKIGGDKSAFATTVPQTGATYTNPGAAKGVPGTGGVGGNVKVNPQGTLDRGTLPQRYIDKYGGRSVLGQQQIKMSPSAAARTFGGQVVPSNVKVTGGAASKPFQQFMNMTPGQKGVAFGAAGAAAVAGSELLAPQAAEPNVSGKDLSKRISDRLPGYSIGDFAPTGKGDHYTAPILDPQGNPVMNPRTGKPVTIGGGLRGKNQYSNSALGTLTNAINDIKGGFADKTGQSKGATKYSVDKKKPVTKTASKTRPQVQPQPTTRSTIKSMPASMMGKTTLQPPSSVANPGVVVDPLNTNPYSMYNPTSGLSPRVRSTLGKFRSGTRALRNIRFDYELDGDMLNEQNRARILREVKNDVVVPDEKKENLKGYRPKFGALHAEYDKLMQKAECPPSFKPMDETVWTKKDKQFNARVSQERKNEVLDHLGTGDHYWEILTETGRKRSENGLKEKYGDYTLVRKEHLVGDTLLFLVDENGKKETILQSEYSDRIARQIEEPLWEQETLNAPNDPLIKRIRSKLAAQIDYPDKPSPMGFPDDMPPDMINGFHPEYGKRSEYYNTLDPKSADAMPTTGDPEIDQKVAAQKTQPPLLQRVNKRRKQSGKPNS